MTPAQYRKDFIKLIKETAYSRHDWDVFKDFCEIAALTIHQLPYQKDLTKDADYERIESRYLEEVKRYERPDLDRFAKMFAVAINALGEQPQDFLGDVMGELELHNADAGQFFTPFEVSRMMAEMQAGDIKSVLQDKPYITVSDPACGAGGMLIAFALVCEQQGIDPRAFVLFDGIDVDRRCFNMCYFQLAACNLRGVVHQGNTLSWQFQEHRITPQERLFQEWARPARMIHAMRELLQMEAQPVEPEPQPEPAPVLALPPQPDIKLETVQLSLFDLSNS